MNLRYCLVILICFPFLGLVSGQNGGTEYVIAAYPDASCSGRCDETNTVFLTSKPNMSKSKKSKALIGGCSCSLNCMKQGICCEDYIKVCHNVMPSCSGICGQNNTTERPCQCHSDCVSKESNCCPDYYEMCLKETVSDQEIEDMAESVLFWQKDSIADYLTINFQQMTDQDCSIRNSTRRFLELNDTAKIPTTYFRLKELYPYYDANVSHNETDGQDPIRQVLDQDNFLFPIIQSNVMRGVMKFLMSKSFITEDESQFLIILRNIWFGLYSRKNDSTLGSSGFEHVFIGELSGNQVLGFHNWMHFLEQEDDGKITYNGYLEKLKINKKVTVASFNFKWYGSCKPITSMFVGTSPEFELALYTLCWFTRPNSLCPIVLNGNKLSIQTYVQLDKSGKQYVATAYPVLSSSSRLHFSAHFNLMVLIVSMVLYWK